MNVDKYIIKIFKIQILVLFSFYKMFPNTVKTLISPLGIYREKL